MEIAGREPGSHRDRHRPTEVRLASVDGDVLEDQRAAGRTLAVADRPVSQSEREQLKRRPRALRLARVRSVGRLAPRPQRVDVEMAGRVPDEIHDRRVDGDPVHHQTAA